MLEDLLERDTAPRVPSTEDKAAPEVVGGCLTYESETYENNLPEDWNREMHRYSE